MFVGGRNAVQLFYIISGFLISYVLVESRTYSSVSTFYINRYLRLYPIYFFVAASALTVIVVMSPSQFLTVYQEIPTDAICLLVFSNLLMFGQDWVMFSGIQHGSLVFSTDFQHSEVLLYHGLLIPQAWTLGVELTFYLIAPFVLPNRRTIYVLLIASIALRIYLISSGLGTNDPWTYRFFPAELAFFLIGALAHQVLRPFYQKLFSNSEPKVASLATYLLIVLSLCYFLIPLSGLYRTLLLFGSFVLLVPLAFVFQSRSRLDAWIGNLSYPIYIGHLLMIGVASQVLKIFGVGNQRIISAASVVLSIVFAIFLNYAIGSPFERIRGNIKRHKSKMIQRKVPAS